MTRLAYHHTLSRHTSLSRLLRHRLRSVVMREAVATSLDIFIFAHVFDIGPMASRRLKYAEHISAQHGSSTCLYAAAMLTLMPLFL